MMVGFITAFELFDLISSTGYVCLSLSHGCLKVVGVLLLVDVAGVSDEPDVLDN